MKSYFMPYSLLLCSYFDDDDDDDADDDADDDDDDEEYKQPSWPSGLSVGNLSGGQDVFT
jgi:hypothetical protein